MRPADTNKNSVFKEYPKPENTIQKTTNTQDNKRTNLASKVISRVFSNKHIRKLQYMLDSNEAKLGYRKNKKNKGNESMRRVGSYFNPPLLKNSTYSEASEYQKEKLESLISDIKECRSSFVENNVDPFFNSSRIMTNIQIMKFTGQIEDNEENRDKIFTHILEFSSQYKKMNNSIENVLCKLNYWEKKIKEEIDIIGTVFDLHRADKENYIYPDMLKYKNKQIITPKNTSHCMISTPFLYSNNLPNPPTSTNKKKRNKKINISN